MQEVIIFTDEYPFGFGEEYLTPEIELLSKYTILTVVTANTTKPRKKLLNEKVKIVRINRDISQLNFFKKIKFLMRCVYKKFFWEEILLILIELKKYNLKIIFERVYDSLIYAVSSEYIYDQLKRKNIIKDNSILYTYWMTPDTLALINHYKNKTKKIVTRVHGYDLYQERRKTGRQPYRQIINKKIDKIYFACEFGMKYYLANFHSLNNKKAKLAVIGAKKYYDTKRYEKKDFFHIYSCSSLHPLKNVEQIADSLALIENDKIYWTHIGSNNNFSEVYEYVTKKLKNKANITVRFLGRLENKEVHKFLSENLIDVMITLSKSEGGCPVSIQEAMSYGIPIIGTSNGGISEMIKNNGILLSQNPSNEEVSMAIKKIMGLSSEEVITMRKNSYIRWSNIYNSDINSQQFFKELTENK